MTVANDDPRWEPIDEQLLIGNRIVAFKLACEQFAWKLPEAIDEVPKRWEYLVETTPHAFKVPLEGYWNNVYT